MMKPRRIALLLLLAAACAAPAGEAVDPSAWRGFNLTDKFHLQGRNGPFQEDDFRWISELGFNFVRLPMDYRVWIEAGDWLKFNETVLEEIDQAVRWGQQYGIHVCINFHRAPGYTVAQPREATDLWTDPATQEVCARHWALFARRYRDVPPEALSFNLMNEPGELEEAAYARVVRKLVGAIRAESPDRPIVVDGLRWGQEPCRSLMDLNLIQATRGYQPTGISHYRASWISGGESMPLPAWPTPQAPGFLAAPAKPDLHAPLEIRGPFPEALHLRFRVGTVSGRALLRVLGDDRELFREDFVCGPGAGAWKQAVHRPEWNVYQNIYDRDYSLTVPAGVRRLQFVVLEGDWMTLTELGLKAGTGPEARISLQPEYGQKPERLQWTPGPSGGRLQAGQMLDRAWLQRESVAPWQRAEAAGIRVLVGEWGAYNKTPHEVTLRWMRDCLENWKAANWGWALWNFRGSFGILDSGRADVHYEDFHGHQLDRTMLELLQAYRTPNP